MWLWISWSSGPQKIVQASGYFNCPACERRRPCELSQIVRRTYLYGIIPLSSGKQIGPEFYFCLECQREFQMDGSYGYDFGLHTETQTWRCFKCKKEIPHDRFDCPHCGFQYDFGQRKY
jgi:DNA-directed RNA polymerase subunit RPC12/RpoP